LPRILPEREKRLLREAGKGNEASFTQLFYAYKDKLYGFVLRMNANPQAAEDIVQDVFLKIWERRESLAEIENFNAFIFRVSRNHTLNHMRHMARETLVRMESSKRHDAAPPLPDETLMYNNLRQTLSAIVATLPRQQKAVYQLSREARLRQDEIATRLDISLPTVKNHLSQALRTIREKMRAYHLNPVLAIVIWLTHWL